MSDLDPVQVAALAFAFKKPGVMYNCEQGLGKSLIALKEFDQLAIMRLATRALIVSPNSFKQGWLDEIEKHGFDFDAHIYTSEKKENAEKWMKQRYDRPPVLIINYDAIRRPMVQLKLIAWMRVRPTLLALDESIQIKGHNTEQSKAALMLAREAAFVRCLTGRPQTQGPHDLWAQLQAIGLYKERNYYAFRGMFCQMGGWEGKQVVGAINADILAKSMEGHVFQARKKDWAPGLPRKDYSIRDYEMLQKQRAQYKQMEEEFILELERETVAVDVAVAKYEKLSQIMAGFILNDAGEPIDLMTEADNPRVAALREAVEATDEKVAVVYRHRHSLAILSRAFKASEPAWIRGEMKPEEVTEQKRRFNEDPECRMILLQVLAGKYGHTLLAGSDDDRCGTMLFFENSYSTDDRAQIEDRIHRRGAIGEYVQYIDFCGSALDRRVIRALQRKESIYRAVFEQLRKAVPA